MVESPQQAAQATATASTFFGVEIICEKLETQSNVWLLEHAASLEVVVCSLVLR